MISLRPSIESALDVGSAPQRWHRDATDSALRAGIESALMRDATVPTPPQPAASVCGTLRSAGMSNAFSPSGLAATTSQLVHGLTSR